jgi:hypothetical protein
MRVRLIAGPALLAMLLSCVTASAVSARRTTVPRVAARVLVYAQEWSLWSSRPSLPAGSVTVQLWNRGEDAHDLRIRRLTDGRMVGRAQGLSVTQSGRLTQAAWKLQRGTYELYCSMPGHLARGMHSLLGVR